MKNIFCLILVLLGLTVSTFGQGKFRDPFFPPFQTSPRTSVTQGAPFPNVPDPSGYGLAPAPEPVVEKMFLTGIIWDEEKPYAMVTYQNRKHTVSVNDTIADKQVVQITRSRVILKSRTKTYILEVGKDTLL